VEPEKNAPHGPPRSSTRVRMQLPVTVTSLDPAVSFSDVCYTLVVNLQGCALRMPRAFGPGSPLRLEQLPGGARVTGFVANCVPLGNEGKLWVVGVQLSEPGNHWGITNPPADWRAEGTTGGEATTSSAKSWPYNLDPAKPTHKK